MSEPSPTENQRLHSLDLFRGITIAAMILANSPGNSTAYWPLEHAEWHGLTPTDLVFPFFLFIVGVSIVYSLKRRLDLGAPRGSLLVPMLKRTAIIFGLGLLLNGFPHYDLASIRLPGVLQRIALCYAAASLSFLFTNLAVELLLIVACLVGYWWCLTHIGVPGFPLGDLSREGNVAAYMDRLVLGKHIYRPVYDPEGILSTLPAIATTLFGNVAGRWLQTGWKKSQKVTGMLQAGVILLLVGVRWSFWFPLNKALWTSSYVLVTAGWAVLGFAACYWVVEVKRWTRWGLPFQVLGLNALAVYFLHVFFLKLQNVWKVPGPDGVLIPIRVAFTNHVFGPWLSPQAASLAYAVLYTLFWTGVFYAFYKRKIFIKV